jgi:HK97 family phage prohead protease
MHCYNIRMDKIKLTDEIKTNFLNAMHEKGFDALFKSINELSDEDTGTFEVIITTEDTDRMGEVIKLDGWDLTNYMKNPVVLWGHDHYKMPIGICTGIERTATGLLARGKFAPGEEGQQVRALYDLGVIRATSVGFIEKDRTGNLITKAELIEFSFVSVPANPMALSTLIKSNISVNEMVTKGFMKVETKDDEPEEAEKDEEEKEEVPADDEKVDTEEDGEKMVKISKSKLASIKLAVKEAGEVLEDIEEDESEEEEIKSDEPEDDDSDADDSEEGGDLSDDEKAFKHFTESRKLSQIAATAIAESLAEMRKATALKLGKNG